jgi:hypothetical protein
MWCYNRYFWGSQNYKNYNGYTIGGIACSFWIMWQGCHVCERQRCWLQGCHRVHMSITTWQMHLDANTALCHASIRLI